MTDQRGKKYVARTQLGPPKHAGRLIDIKKETSIEDVIGSALGVIKQQVDTIAAKSRLGGLLPETETKALRTHIQSLIELSREDRERSKHDGIEEWLAQLSNEELIKMAQGQIAQSGNLDGAVDVQATSSADDKEPK